jgi:SMI1/KNR4 family protein SUKH-1
MLACASRSFPRFAALAPEFELEDVKPPLSLAEIANLERQLGLKLPPSYKALLACSGGFCLVGGVIRFAEPFFHKFRPFHLLTSAQQDMVKWKGGAWPPPSEGMLCFAEFWMEADGDQVLFDVSQGLINDEYPVMYYAHESRPPSVRLLASTFVEFMEGFLEYPAFR